LPCKQDKLYSRRPVHDRLTTIPFRPLVTGNPGCNPDSAFSTRNFAGEHTGRIIIPALRWLFPWASVRALYIIHFGIRKLAHAIEFGAFSTAVFRGVRDGHTGWRWSWALATLVVAAAFAVLDEWHQSFVPLRQSSPIDVAIDTFGALLAQLLVVRCEEVALRPCQDSDRQVRRDGPEENAYASPCL
jgi:hypothetical protein